MASGTGISEVKAEGAGADKTTGTTAGTTREEAAEAGAPRGEAAGAVVGLPEHFEPSPTRSAPDPSTKDGRGQRS
jgi:hypothetical protein